MLSYVDVTFSLLDIKFYPEFSQIPLFLNLWYGKSLNSRERAISGLVFVTLSETFNNYKQLKREKVIKNVIVQ